MPRPIFFAARSGRFVNDKTDDVTIVDKSGDDLVYRIHNTSKFETLGVNFSKNANPAFYTIPAGGSIDLFVKKGASLYAGKGKGVYDLLKNSGSIRSGSFTGDVPIAILDNKKCVYRIINSSDVTNNIIEILNASAVPPSKIGEIGPDSSLDIVLTGTIFVKKKAPGGPPEIEGVFDLLGEV